MNFVWKKDKAFSAELDNNDALSHFRQEFCLPKAANGSNAIYFCGNSLGLQPKLTRDYVLQELDDWASLGVEGHFHAVNPWVPYHETLTAGLCEILGAKPCEVIAMNSLTVNHHLMMVSFYRPTKQRYKILMGPHPFPSNRYALHSELRFHGFDPQEALLEFKCRDGEEILRMQDFEALLEREGEKIALVSMEGVNYYTGQALDVGEIVRIAKAKGCAVGLDLAHGVGNIPYQLNQAGPDYAVWCSYKYLNGGPGCIGGAFVHERHARAFDLQRFAGWWGHNKDKRFRMDPELEVMHGAEGWQVSNPSILPLACLRASLDLFQKAGIAKLRQKSKLLTGYLEFLLKEILGNEIAVITPRDPLQRGAQLSLKLKTHGKALINKLIKRGVICDYREPNVIRIAPVPLYNTFKEVYDFVTILKELNID